jgi:cell division protein ZapA (FtsZ GTPase activity inhibitor)
MKRANISITVLGEAYNLSGDPTLTKKAAGLFQEMLERIEKENRGEDISTHRLGAMTGIALAEQLLIFQKRQEKKTNLIDSVQIQVRSLIEILEILVKKSNLFDKE